MYIHGLDIRACIPNFILRNCVGWNLYFQVKENLHITSIVYKFFATGLKVLSSEMDPAESRLI